MARARTALLLIAVTLSPGSLAAQSTTPPTLDCALGFDGLLTAMRSLSGAQWDHEGGYDIATLAMQDTWRVQIAFTEPGHPAHPAVTLRTLRRQVTDVWTADSKGCGYGNKEQFAILMGDMKSGDIELTSASRLAAERKKEGQSMLGPAP
jgi:hypothetical protein